MLNSLRTSNILIYPPKLWSCENFQQPMSLEDAPSAGWIFNPEAITCINFSFPVLCSQSCQSWMRNCRKVRDWTKCFHQGMWYYYYQVNIYSKSEYNRSRVETCKTVSGVEAKASLWMQIYKSYQPSLIHQLRSHLIIQTKNHIWLNRRK